MERRLAGVRRARAVERAGHRLRPALALAVVARGRRGGAQPARPGRARRDPRGRRRRARAARALLAALARPAPRRVRRRRLGRPARTARSDCSATTGRRAGRRSDASSSRRGRTSSRRSSRTATFAGRSRAQTFASRAGQGPRTTRGSRTSTEPGIRVVAGDGTGDRLVVSAARGPLAWRPGDGFVLAYATSRRVQVLDVETGRVQWQRPRPSGEPLSLEWSADGRLLLATSRAVTVYGDGGAVAYEFGRRARFTAAALASGGRELVFAQVLAGRGEVWTAPRLVPRSGPVLRGSRRLFGGSGAFDHVSWTTDGRWVLVAWPAADQWVFVRSNGAGIRGVANVSEQFRSRSFPRIEGWCCSG